MDEFFLSLRCMKLLATLFLLLLGISANAQLNKYYFFWQAGVMISEERNDEAEEMLSLLLSTDGELVEAYFLRGVARYNQNKLDDAESDFSAAIARNPVYTMAYGVRGITRARLDKYRAALDDFDMASELRPDLPTTAQTHLLRGHSLLGLGDTIAGQKELERAIKLDGEHPMAYYRRGLIAAEQNRWDDALVDMTLTLERDSMFVQAYAVRAGVHRKLGNHDAAMADFRTAEYLSADKKPRQVDEFMLNEVYETLKLY